MPFLLLLAIELVIDVAAYLIQRNQTNQQLKGGAIQGFQAPTSTAGNPIPVWWGVADVAPNMVWYGNLQKVKRHQWFYLISGHLLLGWGVINEIVEMSFNGKSGMHWGYLHQSNAFFKGGDEHTPLGPGTLLNTGAPLEFCVMGNHGGQSASSQSLFGGDDQGGGVGGDDTNDQISKGHMAMYWGFDDPTAQPIDAYLSGSAAYGATCSSWPQFSYLRMGKADGTPFYIAAGSGTPAAIKVICRRTAWWDIKNTGTNSPLGQTPAQATIRFDANPAEVLYDIITHKGYGIGRDPSTLDMASFIAAATTLRTETISAGKVGFGISVTLTSLTSALSTIQGILQTIDATLCTNPVTGLLRLKLNRFDYVVADLPVLDATNTSGVQYAPSTWAGTINEVKVTYNRFVAINDGSTDPVAHPTNITYGFVNDVATDQDAANFQSTKRVRSLAVNLPYITDADVAQLACARLRRAHSVPLARYAWKMNRGGYGLMQGDAVNASESAFGVSGLILRITTIDYGTLESGVISCQGVQDVFSVTSTTYVAPAPVAPVPTPTSTDNSGTGYSVRVPPDAPAPLWGAGF